MGLPVANRIRKQRDFDKVREEGVRLHCGPFLLQLRQPASPGRRLGVIASRRVGNAVVRNRGKRILRELFRQHAERLPEHADLIAVLRPAIAKTPFEEIESRYLEACDRFTAKVVKSKKD